jgi:molybdopterin molybdotransferase
LTRVAQKALDACDMVIFTAGSSASTRDFTVDSVNSLGKPGVLVHGINIRPGKPTILAACKSSTSAFPKPVIGLPGNPVSALVIAGLFVKPVIQQLLGITPREVQPYVVAQISINLASQAGREDWIPVRLNRRGDTWIAEPVFGKSNLIFTLVRSDGLICIPQDANGLEAGTTVEVFLL